MLTHIVLLVYFIVQFVFCNSVKEANKIGENIKMCCGF